MSKIVGESIDINLVERKYGDVIHYQLLGADSATAANYTTIPFITQTAIEIISISASWTTASTSGTLQVERLQGTEAPGAGDDIMATTISTAGTANTVVTRQGNNLTAFRQLEQGDRLAIEDAGTLTNLANLQITIYYKPRGRGDYR